MNNKSRPTGRSLCRSRQRGRESRSGSRRITHGRPSPHCREPLQQCRWADASRRGRSGNEVVPTTAAACQRTCLSWASRSRLHNGYNNSSSRNACRGPATLPCWLDRPARGFLRALFKGADAAREGGHLTPAPLRHAPMTSYEEALRYTGCQQRWRRTCERTC